jgi:hypothetical protein
LSFIPVTTSTAGFVTSFQKRDLNRFSTLNIFSLFLLIVSLNVYFCLMLP